MTTRIAIFTMVAARSALVLTALSLAAAGCASNNTSGGSSDRVALTMHPVGDSVWELSYRDADGESRFRLRPHLRALPDSLPFVASVWTFYAAPGFAHEVLLGALARAHGNPASFRLGEPVDSMRIDVALLAIDAARNSQGAFGRAGTGTWIAAKLFFADGQGELYFNINPAGGEAEFAAKDEEYGPVILREVSRLRPPSARKSSNDR